MKKGGMGKSQRRAPRPDASEPKKEEAIPTKAAPLPFASDAPEPKAEPAPAEPKAEAEKK